MWYHTVRSVLAPISQLSWDYAGSLLVILLSGVALAGTMLAGLVTATLLLCGLGVTTLCTVLAGERRCQRLRAYISHRRSPDWM